MTNPMSPRDPDTILAAWLEEGPAQLPETTRRAIAVGLRSTRQNRRVLDVPWRPNAMNPFARLAIAAAAIVIVAGGALYLFTPGNQGVGGPPAATPSPSVPSSSTAPSPSPAPSPSWQTVSSERFGYSVQIPGTWMVSTLADDLPDTLYPGQESEYGDRWDEPVSRVPWMVVAVRDPSPEETLDAWMAKYTADLERDCATSEAVVTEIDGVPGTVRSVTCLPGMAAFEGLVAYEGRAYVITVAGSSQQRDAIQTTFDRILASFQFTTSSAAVPGSFTSPRYGYTVDYPGGIHTLASEQDWAEGLVASPSAAFLDRFTGNLGSPSAPGDTTYFTGIASQPLPPGVSGDDWMAEHIRRNWAQYGDTCGGRPEDWMATSVAGVTGLQIQADCGAGPASVTEVVFVVRTDGWVITGDTPLVEVLRESFRLPS